MQIINILAYTAACIINIVIIVDISDLVNTVTNVVVISFIIYVIEKVQLLSRFCCAIYFLGLLLLSDDSHHPGKQGDSET